jgi:predicted membrane channel-forming protein YqfA (hemolysin III family)
MIAIQFLYSLDMSGIEHSIPYLLMLIVYSTLAFLIFRGNKIAMWIITVSILLSGIGAFLIGVFLIDTNQLAMKAIFILLGLYFIYGGIQLISGRNRGRAKEA